jgi:hypothetical protein
MAVMRRSAVAIVVVLLITCTSGVPALVVAQLRSAGGPAGFGDPICQSTCVTCGCSTEAAEPALRVSMSSLDRALSDIAPHLIGILRTDPREILHVPKTPLF